MITTCGRFAWLVCSLFLLAACATGPKPATSEASSDTAATSARFSAVAERPPELIAFLRAMPMGADLHNHLSGTVYAESYIAWAIEDGLCLVVAAQRIAPPPCDAKEGKPLLANAVADTPAYNKLINALSTRDYEWGDVSGHDQFFATFSRFDAAADRHRGDMLAEAVGRAADQNIEYLELMHSPGMSAARKLGAEIGWNDDLLALRDRLNSAGLPAIVAEARDAIDRMEASARDSLGCADAPLPACEVEVRYLAQVIRVFPPAQVFAQTALAFALVESDARVVGLNFVAPEDDRVTLRDYSLQMRMIGALKQESPGVPVTLHAGELTLGLVPPEDLRFHIREAVEIAGAERIGHGVDIMYEDEPYALLARMAEEDILVEINLTSNADILGVEGEAHPFDTYRAHGVPLALSTDDEGVSRIDLTHEYVRAVRTYDLTYEDVKTFSRNSLTYAFLAGDSLWADPEAFTLVAPCAGEPLGAARPSADCRAFLGASEKARLQWQLEAAYRTFEAQQATRAF